MTKPDAAARRYLLISEDGRHTTLAHDGEPDEEALDTAAESLDSLGKAGWYVLSEGRYRDAAAPILLTPIRRLTAADGTWATAEAAFHARRAAALGRAG